MSVSRENRKEHSLEKQEKYILKKTAAFFGKCKKY